MGYKDKDKINFIDMWKHFIMKNSIVAILNYEELLEVMSYNDQGYRCMKVLGDFGRKMNIWLIRFFESL